MISAACRGGSESRYVAPLPAPVGWCIIKLLTGNFRLWSLDGEGSNVSHCNANDRVWEFSLFGASSAGEALDGGPFARIIVQA